MLRGSAAYAADCAARGENIQGVVNLDMIAYNSDAERIIDLYARTGMTDSLELTHAFSDVVGVYGLALALRLLSAPVKTVSRMKYPETWEMRIRRILCY